MKKSFVVWLPFVVFLALCRLACAQAPSPSPQTQTPGAASSAQEKNLQEYIQLLRSDIRPQKDEIMGAMMRLDVDESAKFWPIYSDYDAELTKLNNQRVANIEEYAREYNGLTNAQADNLIRQDFEFRKQRSELLAKYYGRVKDSLGAVQAARFLQIEDQLLMIIDLRILSSLPVAGQGS